MKTQAPAYSFHTKGYFLLTKPGIIMGNVINTAGGFALASKGQFNFWLFLVTLIGISLVIASACVFNNYIDREHDKKMNRTKNRPFALGQVPIRSALLFAVALGLAGGLLLAFFVNYLVVGLAALGFVVYVLLYTFSKYHTVHGTLIGSVVGAMPPVVGYCAASGRFDTGALILFLIIALWQMPHFFAIAMYRFDDYKAASIPVLPVKKGSLSTKIHMLVYIIAFTMAVAMLTAFQYTGRAFLVVGMLVSFSWLVLCIAGFKSKNEKRWARKMFFLSLAVVMAINIVIPFSILKG